MTDIPGSAESWHQQWGMMREDRDALRVEVDDLQRRYNDLQIEHQLLDRQLAQLRALLVEHHAVGALDHTLIGDDCPVCAKHGVGA